MQADRGPPAPLHLFRSGLARAYQILQPLSTRGRGADGRKVRACRSRTVEKILGQIDHITRRSFFYAPGATNVERTVNLRYTGSVQAT